MEYTISKARDFRKYIHVAIMFAIMLLFQYIPPVGALTPLGMQTLGIFAGVVYGWSTLGMILPSMVGILAFGFLGENTVPATLATAFGDRITIILLIFFLISSLVEEVGLSNYLAQWCVTRKFVAGKPWGIAIMFCIASALISATVNTFAAMFLMCGIFFNFCEKIGIKPGEKYPMLVTMAILYCCSVAGAIFPYMGLAILVVNQLQTFLGLSINYFLYTLIQLILVTFSLGVYFFIAKYIFRPDTRVILENQSQLFEEGVTPLTKHQKIVGGLVLLLILMLFLPEILPETLPLIGFFAGLDIAGVGIAVLIIYFIIMLDHKDVILVPQLAKTLSWDMIFMFATIAPLSKAISNPDADILTFINETMSNLLSGMTPFLFIVAIFILSSIITQIANNAVVMSVIGPIMFTLGDMVGANPYVLTVIAAPFLSVAFMTPAGSVPAAMAFSNHKWIGTKNAYLMGAIIFMINVLMMIVGIPLAELFF